MRILLITPYFYPHKGGSQKYAEELYAHLMEMDSSIKVDVLCYNSDKRKKIEKYRGFTIYRIPSIELLPGQFALPNYFVLIKTLCKLAAVNKYDFVNSHTRFFESSWWTPFVAKLMGVKSVLTDHCADHPTHSSDIVSFIAKYIDIVMTKFISKLYDYVTVTNRATLKFVKSLGIENPYLIYGGVDTGYFVPRKNTGIRYIPKLARKFTKKDVIVTFLGRMIHTKGPELLYQVALDMVRKNKNISFVFAGDGEIYRKFKNENNKNIYFLGGLENGNVRKLLVSTDIFVHPSMHHEGFPNVLLEAGASGCAVITSGMGGTIEIIENKKTGLVIRPDKKELYAAITLLAANKLRRIELAASLREKIVKCFSWRTITIDFRNFIKQYVMNVDSGYRVSKLFGIESKLSSPRT